MKNHDKQTFNDCAWEGERAVNARQEIIKRLRAKEAIPDVVHRWLWEVVGKKIDLPIQKDGIDFYLVGEDPSHKFYIGMKDGKKYVLSICTDLILVDGEWVTCSDGSDEHVHDVASWDGCYLGYY